MSYVLYDVNHRLNARIDDRLARLLGDLRRRTGKTTTEIVRTSIEHYHHEIVAAATAPAEALAGFIGCAEGASDLSRRYKEELTASLSRKA
jgi:hypothetical protein